MRRDNEILRPQVLADADGDRFLAGVQVREAGDLALGDLGVQALLELADDFHPAVGVGQCVGAE